MTISYCVDEEDVVAFHVHVTEAGVRLRPLVTVVAVIVAAGLYWIVATGTDSVPAAVLTAAVGASAYVASAPRLLRRAVGGIVRRRLRAAPSGMLGDRELELTDHALVDRSATGEASIALGAIRGVVRRDDRAFIFIARDLAYILSRHGVTEGSFEGFLQSLERAMARAHN